MSDSASYKQVTGKLDLISRQDAIEWCLEGLNNLPSVEPEERTKERTKTHACDCISRQAAIDAEDGK